MFDLMLKTESPDKPWNDHFCDSFSKPKTTFKYPRLILKYTVAFITAICHRNSRNFQYFTFPGRQNTDCSDISFSVKSKSSIIPSSLAMSIPTLKNEKQQQKKTNMNFVIIWKVLSQNYKHMILTCFHYKQFNSLKGLQCLQTAT